MSNDESKRFRLFFVFTLFEFPFRFSLNIKPQFLDCYRKVSPLWMVTLIHTCLPLLVLCLLYTQPNTMSVFGHLHEPLAHQSVSAIFGGLTTHELDEE